MNKLTELAYALYRPIGSPPPNDLLQDYEERIRASSDFVEYIAYADTEEIKSMLEALLNEEWLSLPVWARTIAYRLICLQEPQNTEILRRAIFDMRCFFDPEWDHLSARLEQELHQIEQGTNNTPAAQDAL